MEELLEELLEVVKFHLPRYENTVKICKSSPAQVNPSDLTFATRFVAMYLFIKVKGSRPMTYQYLTVEMITSAKEKGGFIDQKTFKTAGKYGFDSLILSDANMQVLNGYISYVRPLLKPQCDFVLVNRNENENLRIQRKLHRVMKFTADEDDFLKKGINRHGYGQWTAILRDSDLKFQEGRTADSLKKRAGLKVSSGPYT